jgi:hypothetical protein
MLNKIRNAALTVAALATTAVPSFAALSGSDQTAILAGISDSDTVFFALGGGILVVMAGIWGFKRVKSLMGS